MSGLMYAENGRTFITADTHFGHRDACTLFDRPFDGTEAMETALVCAFNERMGPDDLLYHVGDFVGGLDGGRAKADCAMRVRDQLKVGRIILIAGNHDPRKSRYKKLFDEVHEVISVLGWRGGAHRVVFSHYPMRCWQGIRHGALHCYGHTHGRLEEVGRSTDVGVDCWRFAPVEIDHVLHMLTSREIEAVPANRARKQPVREGG